ncbi:MAG TPA: DoxX family protein [Mycobacteriales bacterium]|jgi:putative oxidoreductase|nr:DoxX family protein [Mycobacteriales bacterium]
MTVLAALHSAPYASIRGVNYATLFLRAALGITMLAHGYNHAWGGGKLPGTARWFESIGIRPGRLHALLATATELGAGVLLILGLLTPLAAAGVIGVMLVALIANHLKNGFFIFRPGEGYEYVLFITLASFALAALGGGKISLDHAFGLHLHGWLFGGKGLIVALAGVAGALLLLATCWRRPAPKTDT